MSRRAGYRFDPLGDFYLAKQEELRALGQAYHERFNRPLIVCVSRVDSADQLLADGWRRVEGLTW